MDALTTNSVDAARLNWNPSVHRHFDEDLYFVLIRFSRAREVARGVDQIMASAGIRHYSSYVTFGHYDALLRVWLTPFHWQRLLSTLASNEQERSRILHLKVSRLDYLWLQRPIPISDLNGIPADDGARVWQHEDQIKQVASTEGVGREDIAMGLVAADILLLKPREPGINLKFFVVIQLIDGGVDPAELMNTLVKHLRERADARQHLSVYVGEGTLGIAVLRMACEDFSQVLPFTSPLNMKHQYGSRLSIRRCSGRYLALSAP